MGGSSMRQIFGSLWQRIVSWLSVLGAAHVVDDGNEDRKDRPSKRPPTKLRLVAREN